MVLEYARRFQSDLRNGRRRPDDILASAQPKGLSEFHLYLRQFGRLVQSAHFQLRSGKYIIKTNLNISDQSLSVTTKFTVYRRLSCWATTNRSSVPKEFDPMSF